ncbi:MAG: hypothetical protein ACE5OP_01685 [Candidatus Glassbacteria bacterium]
MQHRKRIENEEVYQMIWKFTVMPWLITIVYAYSMIILLNYIGASMY